MLINENKLTRQKLCLYKYNKLPVFTDGKRKGIFEACTGFGKTMVAILRIKELNSESPESVTNVVVPNLKLKEDWVKADGHIKTHNLKNVNVYVVNSYVSFKNVSPDYLVCSFLVMDECHRYARKESELFSTVVDISSFEESLGLTATLNSEEKRYLSTKGYLVFDTITEEEAEREGWIPQSVVFNYGITMTEEETEQYTLLNNSFNFYFSLFEHNFELVQACRSAKHLKFKVTMPTRGLNEVVKTAEEWTWWWAQELGWRGEQEHEYHPKKIVENARLFGEALDKRKQFLYTCNSKLLACKKISETFKDRKTIYFSESTYFADKVTELLGEDCKSYHSNLPTEIRNTANEVIAHGVKVKTGKNTTTYYRGVKTQRLFTLEQIKQVVPKIVRVGADSLLKENIKAFEEGKIKNLSTVKKLDEGMNVESIEMVVIASYTSSSRQKTQREGRAKRINIEDPNKRALIIVLYLKNTQEEKAWLKKAQSYSRKIVKVNNVEEIVYFLNSSHITSNPEPPKKKFLFDNSAL